MIFGSFKRPLLLTDAISLGIRNFRLLLNRLLYDAAKDLSHALDEFRVEGFEPSAKVEA
jgi:hypothetical protein